VRGRPANLSRTAFAVDAATIARMGEIHSWGMDAAEVARKTLEGIRRGDFYVFTHPEFRDELREGAEEIAAALPDEEPDARRMVFEERRRQAKKNPAVHLHQRAK
jgi:hypothetical protein